MSDTRKIDDGGPAFPTLHSLVNNSGTRTERFDAQLIGGMSLRDYFAAHAPIEIASWFSPRMPARPTPLHDHDHPNERQCAGEYECRRVNADELSAYDDERHAQYQRQWPYAWADAQIAERAR